MPNALVLKYKAPFQEPYTEEQLINIFHDLKGTYSEIEKNFIVENFIGMPVENYRQFLNIATSSNPKAIIKGSGPIAGLELKNGEAEYDLSEIRQETKNWDINRSGTCIGCGNEHFRQIGNEMTRVCSVLEEMDDSGNCPEYNPKARNSNGGPARKLAEIIDSVCR